MSRSVFVCLSIGLMIAGARALDSHPSSRPQRDDSTQFSNQFTVRLSEDSGWRLVEPFASGSRFCRSVELFDGAEISLESRFFTTDKGDVAWAVVAAHGDETIVVLTERYFPENGGVGHARGGIRSKAVNLRDQVVQFRFSGQQLGQRVNLKMKWGTTSVDVAFPWLELHAIEPAAKE